MIHYVSQVMITVTNLYKRTQNKSFKNTTKHFDERVIFQNHFGKRVMSYQLYKNSMSYVISYELYSRTILANVLCLMLYLMRAILANYKL